MLAVLLLFVTAPGPVPDAGPKCGSAPNGTTRVSRRWHTASAFEGRAAGTGRVRRSHRVYCMPPLRG
ncbi:MAG TPA: hypothetical protein VG796_14995 [Verrucomicrobiales bacterium]|nr:hypothetical protein [Verrucomicrobiales bacterium]